MEETAKTETTIKQRLINEKTELDEKREKLLAFVRTEGFKKIHPAQMSLLFIQATAMLTYSQVLSERIIWLEK